MLSHPFIVDMVQNFFIPVAIYNNLKGEDAQVLGLFQEPAWNNPVVRIIDTENKNLIPRISGNYTIFGLLDGIENALKTQQITLPLYFQLFREELQARQSGTERALFAMYCFWSGEATFGKIPGVISTQAGFMEGKEVVVVEFNPKEISYQNLLEEAKKYKCTQAVFTTNDIQKKIASSLLGTAVVHPSTRFQPDAESKYYLFHSLFKSIPMTPLQATRINATLKDQKNPEVFLSPQQKELFQEIQKHPQKSWPNVIEEDFLNAWEKIEGIRKN